MVELIPAPGGGGGSGSKPDVTDGTTTVNDADPISVSGSNLSSVTVSEPTTGEAAVDVDTVIPTDHIGVDEIDQAINPAWTDIHRWDQPIPSSGINVMQRWRDPDNLPRQIRMGWAGGDGFQWRTTTSGGAINTLFDIPLGFLAINFLVDIAANGGIIETAFQNYGDSNEIQETYNSNQDSFDVRDETNTTPRARMDRTSGDLTIEGTLTEGATL